MRKSKFGAYADSDALRGNAGICGVQVFFCDVYDAHAFRGHSVCAADYGKQIKNAFFKKKNYLKFTIDNMENGVYTDRSF